MLQEGLQEIMNSRKQFSGKIIVGIFQDSGGKIQGHLMISW